MLANCFDRLIESLPAQSTVSSGGGLPLRSIFYPMGYAVEISTNSPAVLHAAEKAWGRYSAKSLAEPVRIFVISHGCRVPVAAEAASPSIEGHIVSIVHGVHDFAVADLTAGFAFASVSQDCVSNPSYFSYHFLEPLIYVLLGARHFVYVHASCISRNRSAVLLCGDSGSGKTCLAYACARAGWDFVSGDAVHLVRGAKERTVIGRPYEIRFRESARGVFPELNRFCPAVRANGKTDLEIDTGQLEISVALKSVARHIVFIERSSVTRLERCTARLRDAEIDRDDLLWG